MKRFLAICNGASGESDKQRISAEEQSRFLAAWAAWAQAHQHALVDPGAPLSTKKLVTAQGVEDFTDSKTGYATVEAGSHDEAVGIFAEHPHLGLMAGSCSSSGGPGALTGAHTTEAPTPPRSARWHGVD